MKKVILNKCFGGFDVSREAYELYAKKKGLELYIYTSNLDYESKEWIYKKANEENWNKTYFTKDMGDNVKISNEDYEKYTLYLRDEHREDPILIEVVEELGDKASGRFGDLKIVEIPDDLDYEIDEYDGIETLHQKVQEW
jgi:hypothetical protein